MLIIFRFNGLLRFYNWMCSFSFKRSFVIDLFKFPLYCCCCCCIDMLFYYYYVVVLLLCDCIILLLLLYCYIVLLCWSFYLNIDYVTDCLMLIIVNNLISFCILIFSMFFDWKKCFILIVIVISMVSLFDA